MKTIQVELTFPSKNWFLIKVKWTIGNIFAPIKKIWIKK